MKKFNKRKYPKTFVYVSENDTVNRRCNVCGSVVLKETFVKGYPYQCMNCDENRYETETHLGEPHSKDELNYLYCDTRDLLLLDDEI